MEFEVYPHQEEAISKLKTGSILYGGVGSGKTLAALLFYLRNYEELDLYVVTTAKKRDSGDWQADIENLGIEGNVDSWNNIKKYEHVNQAFFIFDEQRVVGYSTWGKTFIKITKNNPWILLSATPGDTWMDYIPVFVANGFYRNKTDFVRQHVEYDPMARYPRIKAFHNEGKLLKNRDSVLVPMNMTRATTRHRAIIYSSYDEERYKTIMNRRWNIFEDKPIENASELLQCLRRVVGTDPDRLWNAKVIMDMTDRLIVFYNYNYELEILKELATDLNRDYYQWNGHAHQNIPKKNKWLYFVQYTAGSEGWNCIETNTILFYSLNYSFRTMEQAEGRIDRLNTPYEDLEYYILSSKAKIDLDIYKTVVNKKRFNIVAWARKSGYVRETISSETC